MREELKRKLRRCRGRNSRNVDLLGDDRTVRLDLVNVSKALVVSAVGEGLSTKVLLAQAPTDREHDERTGDVAGEDDRPRDRVSRRVLGLPHQRSEGVTLESDMMACQCSEFGRLIEGQEGRTDQAVPDQHDGVRRLLLSVTGRDGADPSETEDEASRSHSGDVKGAC